MRRPDRPISGKILRHEHGRVTSADGESRLRSVRFAEQWRSGHAWSRYAGLLAIVSFSVLVVGKSGGNRVPPLVILAAVGDDRVPGQSSHARPSLAFGVRIAEFVAPLRDPRPR